MKRASSHHLKRIASLSELIFGKLLLILQMPKTGSQTVEASLKQCRLPHRILRCHYISARRQAQFRRSILGREVPEEWKQLVRSQMEQMAALRRTIRVRRLLSWLRITIPRIELITAVREPIGVALSSLFENHAFFVPRPQLLAPQHCRELLLRPGTLPSIQEWFDVELKPITGIDVYQKPFPRKKSYAIYQNGQFRVLLYRLEAMDRLGPMLREFLGCSVPGIVHRNLGENKDYAEAYRDAKAQISLPVEFVRASYAHKFARQFYSTRELSNLVQHWTRTNSARRRTAGGARTSSPMPLGFQLLDRECFPGAESPTCQ